MMKGLSAISLVIGMSLAGVAVSVCDLGWIDYVGKCYLFQNVKTTSFPSCNDYCANQGANILCIDNAMMENFVRQFATTSASMWLYYGDSGHEGTFTWGPHCTNAGYAHWAAHEPSGRTSENCVEMYGVAHDPAMTGFNDIPCSGGNGASCHCQKAAAVGAPTTQNCPAGWTMNGNKCYLMDLSKAAVSWSECNNYCDSNSGSMLCIEDQTKENYILDHMGGRPAVWLSYNDIAVEGSWQWAAGCASNGYTHWDTQHHEPNGGTVENCVEMYAGNVEGRGWNDARCNSLDVSYPKYCFCQTAVTYVSGSAPVPSVKPTRRPTRKPIRSPHITVTDSPTTPLPSTSSPTFDTGDSSVLTDDAGTADPSSNTGGGGVSMWLIVGVSVAGLVVLGGCGTYAYVVIDQCCKRASAVIATTATYEDIAEPRLYVPVAYRIAGLEPGPPPITMGPYKIAAADPYPYPAVNPPAVSVPLEYPSFGATGGWGSGYSGTTPQGNPPAGSVNFVPTHPQPQMGNKATGSSAPPRVS